MTNVIIKTDNEAELNRIKNLLPEYLSDKVISRSVYEILRGMVDRFIFEAAGGAQFNNILCLSGLPVTNINQIIASYLPQAFDRILEIIKEVGIPACLPNAESKETYRELLAQSIGRAFPNYNAAQANDQKQAGTDDIKGSTPATPGLFQSGAPVADSQLVVPTRGQRREELTQVFCVMQ